MTAPIYLDHNASTPVLPRVRDAVMRALEEGFGNPSASHVYGRRAKAIVEHARAEVAALLGCDAGEIVFTSGGTEANNLALRGVARAVPGVALVTTALDHPATLAPARLLAASGTRLAVVGARADGTVDPEAIARAIPASGPTLVSVIAAQNETGVLQPIAEIAAAARARGAWVHVDAAQAVGKIPVDVRAWGAQLLSIAGHKLYAPKGVGALFLAKGTPLEPFAVGAGHERGLRPGTENVAGIAGLGEACALAREDLAAEAARQTRLRDRLIELLGARGFVVHGVSAPRLPNTVNGHFQGILGSTILARTPGVAFTTGSACHAGEERASEVLLAMGLAVDDALGAIRLTLGRGTTDADVERAAAALLRAAG